MLSAAICRGYRQAAVSSRQNVPNDTACNIIILMETIKDLYVSAAQSLMQTAKERLDRALIEDSKTQRSKNNTGKRDLRTP